MSEPVIDTIRRELRRISVDGKFSEEEVRRSLAAEVIKRDVLEDAKAKDADRLVAKASKKAIRKSPTPAVSEPSAPKETSPDEAS